MTLLTIARAIADEVGDTRPSAVITSTDPTVQKYLRLANRAGSALMKKVAWQALRKEKTFTALAQETQTGILPSDFDRFIPETFWDRTNLALVSGPIGAVQWQSLKALGYTSPERKFAYRGGSILVIPAFSGGESLAFEYVSNLWAQSSGGTGQTSLQADADVTVIDEELIIRAAKYLYLIDEGLPAGAAVQDFQDYFDDLVQNDQPAAAVLSAADIFGGTSSRHFGGAPLTSGSEFFS